MSETPQTQIDPPVRHPNVEAQFRAWAHSRLDDLLEARGRLNTQNSDFQSLGPFQPITDRTNQGRADTVELFLAVLGFATQLVGKDVIEAVAPTYTAGDPESERGALLQALDLLASVWPCRPRSVGAYARPTHWISDLKRSLEMLNHGQVQPLFRPLSGEGKGLLRWSLNRWHMLGAFWAQHLERNGQSLSEPSGNCRVARAFGLPDETGEATVSTWRTDLYRIRDGEPLYGILPHEAETGLRIANEPLGATPPDRLSMRLHSCAFGTMSEGAKSLDEAGRRYRYVVDLIEEDDAARTKLSRDSELGERVSHSDSLALEARRQRLARRIEKVMKALAEGMGKMDAYAWAADQLGLSVKTIEADFLKWKKGAFS